jgi:hypothetical protein
MRRAAVFAACLIMIPTAGAAAIACPQRPEGRAAFVLADEERDCSQFVPERIPPLALTATQPRSALAIRVLVVTERRDLKVARQLFAKADHAYGPLGLRLVPKFQVVPPLPDLDGDHDAYMQWLKDEFGGRRPAGSDVVYLATHHHLNSGGLADCIGGIADPRHAFAIGMLSFGGLGGVSIDPDPGLPQGPPVPDSGAKLTAHEIGHLFGGHHHYGGDCRGEANEPGRCDVMLSLSPQTLGLHFGLVNGAVVRDQAERYLTGK